MVGILCPDEMRCSHLTGQVKKPKISEIDTKVWTTFQKLMDDALRME